MENTQKTDWKFMTREERGKILLNNGNVKKVGNFWRVLSQSIDSKAYKVFFNGDMPRCNCPDCDINQAKCKHIFAVEFYLKREINEEGKLTEIRAVKVTYAQNWSAYNKSQTNEKIVFMKLLKDLCNNVENPKYDFGRPILPFSDMLFASIMKVYTGFSLRRFISDMKIAKQIDLIQMVPCYSSISNFMNKEEVKPLLEKLITQSSFPLKQVESSFAIDSSGFSTSRFGRWFDYKWGKEKKYRLWLKAHICIGTKTNIITSVKITEGSDNDSPQLKELVSKTAEGFNMAEVSADKAYSSRDNLQAIKTADAIPFIPFKTNATGKADGSMFWSKMYHYFMYKHEEFVQHYHKRSNVETVFHMVKTKFGSDLKSKKQTAQINELLCKLLANNLTVVIQEINELGIKAEFKMEENLSV